MKFGEIIGNLHGVRAEVGRSDEALPMVAACMDAADIDGYRRLEEIGVTHLIAKPWVFYGHGDETLEGKQEGLRRFSADGIEQMR